MYELWCVTLLIEEYIDFYDNMYKIKCKSVYNRKYHIENILNSLCQKHGIEINYENRQKIYKIFKLIDTVLSQVNGNRKRMISVTYVLRKLFEMLGLSCKNIPLSKSKKTLRFYKHWWDKVYGLIKDDIYEIINK